MSFGRQSGPPASAKQVKYLLSLIEKAGYASFREARHPYGLTQRQAGGKFTRSEASVLIDRLLSGEGGEGGAADEGLSMEQMSAADRLDLEREQTLRGMPAGLLAGELERRGWVVHAPEAP